MSDTRATDGTTALDSTLAPASGREQVAKPGFFKRYRLPLLLAVVAVCLYAGSILYILYGRGQIA